MKAVVYKTYGSPDHLQLQEVEKPVPKDNEVRIKVRATSINEWDWSLIYGVPFVNRLMNGLSSPNINILGSDIAGEIEAVGKTVKLFKPGDEVYGDLSGTWGGLAEYVTAHENALVLKPASMSFEEAAAIPQAGLLALQGLRDRGNLQHGQKLLINGAGGGTGTFAIQIAKLYQAEITGVDHTEKLAMMRTMGCDHVIDYNQIDFTRSGQRYDLILDVRTDRPIYHYTRVLRTHGTYVTVGGSMNRLFQALMLGPLISQSRKKHVRILALKPNKGLNDMNAFFEAGQVRPVIDKCFPLNETAEAFRYYGNGLFNGKIVIRVSDYTAAKAFS